MNTVFPEIYFFKYLLLKTWCVVYISKSENCKLIVSSELETFGEWKPAVGSYKSYATWLT